MAIEVTPTGVVLNFNKSYSYDTPMTSVNYVNYVNGFMINQSTKEVLFIKKNRPDFQAGKWNGIGGKIEPGEQPIDAMVREFREETGVDSSPEDWTSTIHLVQPAYDVHFYRCFVDNFPAYRTVTDEVVEHWPISSIYQPGKFGLPVLENMLWILPMLVNQQIAWPVTIHLQRGTT